MSRWEQIVAFCKATGLQLVFGLNGATRRPYYGYDAPLDWNLNNTELFVQYVANNSAAHIYAFELGNELCDKVNPATYAADIRRLRQLVVEYWPDGETKPLVAGPDCNPPSSSVWTDDFLGNITTELDVLTYHNYVGYGLDPKLAQEIMNTSWAFFNRGPARAAPFIDGWQTLGKGGGMEIWAGEIAAAWHSGEPGITNRYISSFWYADALALLASIGHTGFQRQSLVGGNYALLNRTTMEPNPDFFVAQLFHDLMGERVLDLNSTAYSLGLRTYAHCHADLSGRATLLLIKMLRRGLRSPWTSSTCSVGLASPRTS